MALGNLLGDPVQPFEARSGKGYLTNADRYVVSFITGWGQRRQPVGGPTEAVACAMAMIFDASGDENVWFVYDRVSGETYAVEQGEAEKFMHEHGLVAGDR